MTKFRVVFLVSLMTAISGCCSNNDPACDVDLAGSKCIENVKKSAVPCVNNDDIKAKSYWGTLKERLNNENSELVTKCDQLKLVAHDGKQYPTDCINVAGILRLIQEIPTKKAEPFKKWLAKTGFERIQEQQNPDLITQRMMLTYELQGRDKRWIRNRIDGVITRKELTDEWRSRDVKEKEYGTLTNIISQETFGISISKHKEIKGLKKENLRDNMTEMELIFQRMGEQATIDETKARNAQGFEENKQATRKGARNAGIAREAYENASRRKVVSCENFISNIKQAQLELPENDKPEDIIAPFTRDFKKK